MPLIGMIGPHAVGKTTAAERWAKRYRGLWVALTDNQREACGEDWDKVLSSRPNVREWKGSKEEKIARTKYHQERGGITLVESARGFSTWLSVFRPEDFLIVLTCPEPQGREWLVQRREGKPLAEFWTERRLDYECVGHLLNSARKLPPSQVKHFIIEDRTRDWPAVDAFFGYTFRRMNNALLRRNR